MAARSRETISAAPTQETVSTCQDSEAVKTHTKMLLPTLANKHLRDPAREVIDQEDKKDITFEIQSMCPWWETNPSKKKKKLPPLVQWAN